MKSNGHAGNGSSFTALRHSSLEPPRIIPPADDLEQQLLATLLYDNSRLADTGTLAPEHFARDIHARIFSLIKILADQGIPAKPQTLRHLVAGDPALATLPDYLDRLTQSVVVSLPNAVGYYADELVAAAFVRNYVATANDLCEAALNNAPRHGWKAIAEAIVSEHRQLETKAPRDPLVALDLATLPDTPTEPRSWLVANWFPMLETVGLGGPGGEGKTLLAHMLATSAATGNPWLGLPVTPMKAALVLCEDRARDAHWRQANICRHLGCSIRELTHHLKIYPRRDAASNKLGVFDNDNRLHLTTLFFQLLEELRSWGAQLVVLDTRSDVFLGNQNNEEHARSFVRQVCDRIAATLDGIVFLLYQPSKTGLLDHTGMSGSVQWDAAFRARALLGRSKTTDDDEDPNRRSLQLVKSNFSATGTTLEIRWHNGVFIPHNPTTIPAYQRAANHAKAERCFLNCLNLLTTQHRHASTSPASPNYAPKLFAKLPAAEGCSPRSLENAMLALLQTNRIANTPFGPPSRNQYTLVKVATAP